jgi:hypothetical protein
MASCAEKVLLKSNFINGLSQYIAALFLLIWVVSINISTDFRATRLNSDMMAAAALYNGMRHHGLSFLSGWLFPPDSQILTLLPFTTIYYYIFGISVGSIIIQGWVIYFLTVLACGYLSFKATKSKLGGYVTAIVLLIANNKLLFFPTIIAYPVSHNATFLVGVLTIIIYLAYLGNKNRNFLYCFFLLVFVEFFSDQWALAAIIAPIATVIMFHSKHGLQRKARITLIAGVIFAMLAARLAYYVLQLYWLVPRPWGHLSSVLMMENHLAKLERNILLVSHISLEKQHWFGAVVLIFIYFMTTLIIVKSFKSLSQEGKTIILTAFYSCAYMCAAFIATSFAGLPSSARFIINVYYFIPVIAIIAIHSKGNIIFRSVASVWIIVLLITANYYNFVDPLYRHANFDRTTGIERFLIHKGYSSGFGQYFDVNANVISVLSQGKLILRPVACYNKYLIPQRNSDYKYWYNSIHGDTFVVVFPSLEKRKWTACSQHTFGQPVNVLTYTGRKQKYSILVYSSRKFTPNFYMGNAKIYNSFTKYNLISLSVF